MEATGNSTAPTSQNFRLLKREASKPHRTKSCAHSTVNSVQSKITKCRFFALPWFLLGQLSSVVGELLTVGQKSGKFSRAIPERQSPQLHRSRQVFSATWEPSGRGQCDLCPVALWVVSSHVPFHTAKGLLQNYGRGRRLRTKYEA